MWSGSTLPVTKPGPKREKWSAARLAYTAEQRKMIMACIQRHNWREKFALERAVIDCGGRTLPRPHLREQIRAWYRERWSYLLREYEKILPHVDELPDEQVAHIVKNALMEADETHGA